METSFFCGGGIGLLVLFAIGVFVNSRRANKAPVWILGAIGLVLGIIGIFILIFQ